MKKLLFILCVLAILLSCTSKKPNVVNTEITKIVQNDTIRIANDTLEYEVIIIDPGFTTWLNSVARPRNFYSLPFLENKNYLFVDLLIGAETKPGTLQIILSGNGNKQSLSLINI